MDGSQFHGTIPAVIARCKGVLLVGTLVLLVYHHQTQIPVRKEYRRPGAQQDIRSVGKGICHIPSGSRGHQTAATEQALPEKLPEPVLELAGHRYLRDHIQYALAGGEHVERKGDVDFGLT